MQSSFDFNMTKKPTNTLLKKLITINFTIYLFWCLASVAFVLFGVEKGIYTDFRNLFMLQPKNILSQPWSLFTYAFVYIYNNFFTFLELTWLLYFFGTIIVNLLGERQLIAIYFSSIPIVGLFLVVGSLFLPYLAERIDTICISTPMSTMYTLITVAALFAPSHREYILFVPVQLKYIALIFIMLCMVSIGSYYENMSASIDQGIMNLFGSVYGALYIFVLKYKKYLVPRRKAPYSKDESLVNIDEIWEKMSRTGYDSLTPEEKERLFHQKDKN